MLGSEEREVYPGVRVTRLPSRGLCIAVSQAVGFTSMQEWISHWATSAIDFHRTGVSSQAERPTDFPAVLVLQPVGQSPRKYILSEGGDLSKRVFFSFSWCFAIFSGKDFLGPG